jgi:hypothetical protein
MEKVRQWYLSLHHAFPSFFGRSQTPSATGNGHRWLFCPSCRAHVGELSELFGTVARNVEVSV